MTSSEPLGETFGMKCTQAIGTLDFWQSATLGEHTKANVTALDPIEKCGRGHSPLANGLH